MEQLSDTTIHDTTIQVCDGEEGRHASTRIKLEAEVMHFIY